MCSFCVPIHKKKKHGDEGSASGFSRESQRSHTHPFDGQHLSSGLLEQTRGGGGSVHVTVTGVARDAGMDGMPCSCTFGKIHTKKKGLHGGPADLPQLGGLHEMVTGILP